MSDFHFWAKRYKSQARWTKQSRQYILQQINLPKNGKVLEVGCGSQAVLQEFLTFGFQTFGIDIDYSILNFSNQEQSKAALINADGYKLPFVDNFFDFSYCHFLLLWIDNPIKIINEMVRVTKRSGWICCFAEPDYLARIDSPAGLERLGEMQNKSLQNQGVNLSAGRNLSQWLSKSNLRDITWGILGSHNPHFSQKSDDLEWDTVIKDIQGYFSDKEIEEFRDTYYQSKINNTQILFVPTFYAYAQK